MAFSVQIEIANRFAIKFSGDQASTIYHFVEVRALLGELRRSVTNELVKFNKQLVEA